MKKKTTDQWNDLGLLAIRLGVGGALVAHGTQKLFGWFGGYGPEGTGQWMASMGFKGEGRTNAILAGLGEAGGGALLALGLATGAAGAAVTGTMAAAGSIHVPNGFFNAAGGYELPATFGLIGTALALGGPGRFSLDHALGHKLNRRWMAVAALASTIGSAVYLISTREQPAAAEDEIQATEAAADDAPAGS
jgi:putative oxidoreductase